MQRKEDLVKTRGYLAATCLAVLVVAGLGGVLWGQVAGGTPDFYEIDNGHSTAIFRVKHLGVSYFYGRFNELKGSFTFAKGDPTGLTLNVEIKAASIDTNDERRDQHLKGPDFFHAKRYKTISFKSTKVTKAKDKIYRVTGDLTLHGKTRSITADVEHVGAGKGLRSGYHAGFETTFSIKRTDFGMDYMVGGLGDDIRIIVSIEGIRQKSG